MSMRFGNQSLHTQPDGQSSGNADIDLDIPLAEAGGNPPSFADLFNDEEGPGSTDPDQLKIRNFNRITKITEDPKPFFKDPEYYKALLTGEGDSSKRVHQILQAYTKAEDPQDKSMHRQRLIPAFWDLAASVATKVGSKLSVPKQLLLRYGILLPTAIDAEQRQLLSTIPLKNETGEPVHYVDEWLREIAFGRVSSSAVDETKAPRGNEASKITALLEKAKGRHDAQLSLINGIVQEMEEGERMLVQHAQNIASHHSSGGVPAPYNETQKTSFSEIGDIARRLSAANKRLQLANAELADLKEQLRDLQSKDSENETAVSVDTKAIVEEVNTIKQMAKMCVGRQGNHFPMLAKQYFRGSIRDVATRENVINILADVEYLDSGLFLRTFKQQTNRIVPNVILIACYGEFGICWEPFERFNRATSRGRVAIPLFPKDLRTAVIAACGDLRWQVAKEKAAHYWMEEGLTGWYYQWFSEMKLKGDVKDKFVEDYTLWITKESEGTQKLDRAVREIFWRFIPFPQDKKDNLKNRGFVYAELAKKDQNRAMSDGY